MHVYTISCTRKRMHFNATLSAYSYWMTSCSVVWENVTAADWLCLTADDLFCQLKIICIWTLSLCALVLYCRNVHLFSKWSIESELQGVTSTKIQNKSMYYYDLFIIMNDDLWWIHFLIEAAYIYIFFVSKTMSCWRISCHEHASFGLG